MLYLPKRLAFQEDKVERVTQPRQNLSQLAELSAHRLCFDGSRYSCSVCLNSSHQRDPSCRSWLQGICVPRNQDDVKPVPLTDVFHIGNQVTHSSHDLCTFKDILYCRRCGCHAGKKRLVNLARPCSAPSAAGQRFLENIGRSQ